MGKIRRFLFHPLTNFGMGAILVVSSLAEMLRQVEEAGAELRGHHGIAFYGLVLCVRSLADIVEGTRKAAEALPDGGSREDGRPGG